MISFHRIIDCTEAEGPGKRLCVWTQGCLNRCPGCCNALMQPLELRHLISEDDFCGRIDQARRRFGIEGITLLGGEPFLQAQGLSQTAQFARSLGLTVLTFSGYRLEQLRVCRLPGTDGLLRYTDVLIDGPYLAESPDCGRNWVGSSNQRFWYFTDAYDSSIETNPEYAGIVELRLVDDAENPESDPALRVNGCPKTLMALTDGKNICPEIRSGG